MKLTESDFLRFSAAFGPVFAVLGLMKLTNTYADVIVAGIGSLMVSWVLLTLSSALAGPPITFDFKDITEGGRDDLDGRATQDND